MNHFIPYDTETAELEQAYLNDLALSHTIERLEFAEKELDRLIDELKEQERHA